MTKANAEIRAIIKNCNLHQWEVAERVGIADTTLTRWLRTPLTDEKREMVLVAIQEIAEERA